MPGDHRIVAGVGAQGGHFLRRGIGAAAHAGPPRSPRSSAVRRRARCSTTVASDTSASFVCRPLASHCTPPTLGNPVGAGGGADWLGWRRRSTGALRQADTAYLAISGIALAR